MPRPATILAHASGEWISSDWPVCLVADTASPQRMGAALTYARRYALFTLVGIAGEDDLDAPDLDRVQRAAGPPADGRLGEANGAAILRVPSRGPVARNPPAPRVRTTLAPEDSATARAALEEELAGLDSPDGALAWAKRVLPTKNTLTGDDAGALEKSFAAKIGSLEPERLIEPVAATQVVGGPNNEPSRPDKTTAQRIPNAACFSASAADVRVAACTVARIWAGSSSSDRAAIGSRRLPTRSSRSGHRDFAIARRRQDQNRSAGKNARRRPNAVSGRPLR